MPVLQKGRVLDAPVQGAKLPRFSTGETSSSEGEAAEAKPKPKPKTGGGDETGAGSGPGSGQGGGNVYHGPVNINYGTVHGGQNAGSGTFGGPAVLTGETVDPGVAAGTGRRAGGSLVRGQRTTTSRGPRASARKSSGAGEGVPDRPQLSVVPDEPSTDVPSQAANQTSSGNVAPSQNTGEDQYVAYYGKGKGKKAAAAAAGIKGALPVQDNLPESKASGHLPGEAPSLQESAEAIRGLHLLRGASALGSGAGAVGRGVGMGVAGAAVGAGLGTVAVGKGVGKGVAKVADVVNPDVPEGARPTTAEMSLNQARINPVTPGSRGYTPVTPRSAALFRNISAAHDRAVEAVRRVPKALGPKFSSEGEMRDSREASWEDHKARYGLHPDEDMPHDWETSSGAVGGASTDPLARGVARAANAVNAWGARSTASMPLGTTDDTPLMTAQREFARILSSR